MRIPVRQFERIKRVLEPIERISEVIFGVIMVLTFTGSLSVAEAGRDNIRTMLIGALGCNFAWGVIDAVFYLMSNLVYKAHSLVTFNRLHKTTDADQGRKVVADAVPPLISSVLEPDELEAIRVRLVQLPRPPERARLQGDDWLGALAVFLLVFLSTFPVALPFFFMQDGALALRVSNAIAVVMLFLLGFAFGRCAGHHPWIAGISMVIVGVILVGMTMALGG